MASRRDASSRPSRSTAAVAVVGDSRRTSASVVSTSQSRLARQKSRRAYNCDMRPGTTETQRDLTTETQRHGAMDLGPQKNLCVSVSLWFIHLCALCALGASV